ncbi:hypothetical protein MTO96_026514 [Rhipicephalus appendiculatus]
MPPLRRQQYSAAFKRQVILYAESESNVEAGRKFDVSEKCVREWRKQRTKIFACAATRRSFRGPKSGPYPAVEEAVRDRVHDQRSKSLSVCYDDIGAEARTVAKDMCIPLTEFSTCGISVPPAPLPTASSSSGLHDGNDCCILLSSDDDES